jgi:hypothetical protein
MTKQQQLAYVAQGIRQLAAATACAQAEMRASRRDDRKSASPDTPLQTRDALAERLAARARQEAAARAAKAQEYLWIEKAVSAAVKRHFEMHAMVERKMNEMFARIQARERAQGVRRP